MRIALLMTVTLLLAACGDPIFMFPGGALTGESASPPVDWSLLDNVDTIQVEFREDDPYSHNIWAVGIGSDLYIATRGEGTRWTPMIESNPKVRARINGKLYGLTAVRVANAEEVDRVAAAYAKKYQLDEGDNWVKTGLIFRLDRP
jgi:hypothetical protein